MSRPIRKVLIALAVVSGLTPLAGSTGRAEPPRTLIPIGSDYLAETLGLVADAAVAHDTDGIVHMLVLPTTYSLDAYSSGKSERKKNLTLADNRRGQLADACRLAVAEAQSSQTCSVELVPVLVRADAENASLVEPFFASPVDAIYVLGGDQTVSMQVTAGTVLEGRMTEAYLAGAAFGGNSAGDAVQSRTMINGYVGANGPAEGLRRGTVDVWDGSLTADTDGALERGLDFGFRNVITDQHVFERGRMGRSVNVAVEWAMPVLGMDAATGAAVQDETLLTRMAGVSSGYVIDPLTYGSPAMWGGPNQTLSTRDVAVHLVAPGTDQFDLAAMQPIVGGTPIAAPDVVGRTLPAMLSGSQRGATLLGGGLGSAPGDAGSAFVAAAGGRSADIVVIAAGYARSTTAQADAKAIAAALRPGSASASWYVLGKNADAEIVAALRSAEGVWLVGGDRSRIMPALTASTTVLATIDARWRNGTALMADNAAAAALGTLMAATPPPTDPELGYTDLLDGSLPLVPGLGWLTGANVEPRLLPDYTWPQLLRLAAADHDRIALGIDVGTWITIVDATATVHGASSAIALDPRWSTSHFGTNGSLSAQWMLLDAFVDGESLST